MLDWIAEDIGRLDPEEVLSNKDYLAVVEEVGGYGNESLERDIWLREAEVKGFRRSLIDEDLPCVLKALARPISGVSLEPDYNDVGVHVEHRFRDELSPEERVQGHPYWPWRRLRALGVLGGRLVETGHWLQLLPPARREWAYREIAEAMTGGKTDPEVVVDEWRVEACFHATPAYRATFGLDPEDLVGVEEAIEELSAIHWRASLWHLSYELIALALGAVGADQRDAVLGYLPDVQRKEIEKAAADPHLLRRLRWDERHEAFDVDDAVVRMRACLSKGSEARKLRDKRTKSAVVRSGEPTFAG